MSNFRLNQLNPKNAIKHPNWNMGKKISIDSATLINKVFELIEAKNIFDIDYNKITILTHPKSYVHTIIKFKNRSNLSISSASITYHCLNKTI